MRINSPNEMYQFVITHGLTGLAPELQALVICLDEYARMCSCDPEATRLAKYNQCKDHYVNFASKAYMFSGALLSKITDNNLMLYFNNQLLAIVSR
jgi:hypothetical protein